MKARRLVAGFMAAGILATGGCERGSAIDGPSPSPEGAPSATATADQRTELRGFAIGDAWNDLSDAEIMEQARRTRSVGAQALRIDIEWGRIRPNQNGDYDWSETDRRIAIAKQTGHVVMATLAYAPEWARDPACKAPGPDISEEQAFTCAPANPNDFNDFATEFAHHIAGTEAEETVRFVEIWNEQNNNKIDPERYAAILDLASQSIHMILQDAKIGFGGMAPNAETEGGTMTAPDYLRATNAALRKRGKDPKTVYDAVAFHPYSYPARPGQPYIWNGMTQTEGNATVPNAPNLHKALVAERIDGMDIWLNEFGAPACNNGTPGVNGPEDPRWNDQAHLTPEYQNQVLADFLSWRFQHLNVTIRLVHTLQDKDSKSKDREKCFGVFGPNGLKTPTFSLYS